MLILLLGLTMAYEVSAGVPQELNRVFLVNETGGNLVGLWYRPGNPQEPVVEWSPNVLSTTAISHGNGRGFYLHFPDTCEKIDLRLQDEYGSQYELQHLEICSDKELIVVVDGLSRVARGLVMPEFLRIDLHNDTEEPLAYVFYSPEEFDMWGFDLLGQTTLLNPGESLSILLAADDTRRYDFLALGESNSLFMGRIDRSIAEFGDIYASLYEQ